MREVPPDPSRTLVQRRRNSSTATERPDTCLPVGEKASTRTASWSGVSTRVSVGRSIPSEYSAGKSSELADADTVCRDTSLTSASKRTRRGTSWPETANFVDNRKSPAASSFPSPFARLTHCCPRAVWLERYASSSVAQPWLPGGSNDVGSVVTT
jgi:hypothetical protein